MIKFGISIFNLMHFFNIVSRGGGGGNDRSRWPGQAAQGEETGGGLKQGVIQPAVSGHFTGVTTCGMVH